MRRNGGYIAYTRHGEATVGEDLPITNFHNCSSQRNLSEKGRQQAILYEDLIRSLLIPINRIISSPFCRTIETAALAFGLERVQIEFFLIQTYHLSTAMTLDNKERIIKCLSSIIEQQPPQGSNTMIIAHGFSNMGTVIIRPLGIGAGHKIITTLTLSQLPDLATS